MGKVLFSMDNYNKFIDFIGTDWVKQEYLKYMSNPFSVTHPFIISHMDILNSRRYSEIVDNLFVPKEVYFNIQMLPFKRYDLIGSFIDIIASLIKNPVKFRKRLQNEKEFWGAIYEMIAICIFHYNHFEIERIKEDDSKTPDLYVKKETNHYTVEVTSKNEPDYLKDEKDDGKQLIENISELFSFYKISGQLGISIDYSYKEHITEIFQLCKDIIANRKIGWNSFSEDKITIIFNEIGKWDDPISVDSFIKENILLLTLTFNMGSTLEYSINTTKEIKNFCEVALNYSKNIEKSIKNTVISKIQENQVFNNIPGALLIIIPHNILQNYKIDSQLVENEIKNILSKSKSYEVVFVISEFFGLRNGVWDYNYDILKIDNPLKQSSLFIKSFDTEIYVVNDPNT